MSGAGGGNGTIRILLADDHTLVRRGLRLVLESQPDLAVVAEAGDGREALDLALREEIDVAILDVAMPRLTGLQVAWELSRQRPQVRCLMLSMHDNEQFFFEALRAGASGYVRKVDADDELVEACRAVARGEPFFFPDGVSALVRHYVEAAREGRLGDDDPLTTRETEVVKLIAEGHTTREIARLLGITEHTVDRHRANVAEKLGLRDRVAITRYAIRRGLVQP